VDRRKTNKVGRKGYNINNEEIVSLYLDDGLTMKEIGVKFDISHWTVLDRLKKSGVQKNTRHKVNHNTFSELGVHNCYWAGFIAADGWISNNTAVGLELQHGDKNHLEKLCLFVGRDTKLWVRERQHDGKVFKYASVSLVSKQMVSDLKNYFNIVPNKSLILVPPDLPNYLKKHFVRGYIDGDGHIGWYKYRSCPRLSLVSGSIDMLKWVKLTISGLVPNVNDVSVYHRNDNTHSFEYRGKQAYSILDWLYTGSTKGTRLQRKYERYKEYLKMR